MMWVTEVQGALVQAALSEMSAKSPRAHSARACRDGGKSAINK